MSIALTQFAFRNKKSLTWLLPALASMLGSAYCFFDWMSAVGRISGWEPLALLLGCSYSASCSTSSECVQVNEAAPESARKSHAFGMGRGMACSPRHGRAT
jgi:hypothetical protein